MENEDRIRKVREEGRKAERQRNTGSIRKQSKNKGRGGEIERSVKQRKKTGADLNSRRKEVRQRHRAEEYPIDNGGKIKRNKKKKRDPGQWIFLLMQVLMLTLILGCIGIFFASGYGTKVIALYKEAGELVANSDRSTFFGGSTSIIYDKDGNIISYIKGEKNMSYLTIDQIPKQVQEAMVSIEDKRFYKHIGIDLKALLRAVKSVYDKNSITQGGSTITQQLARNIFLTHQVSWQRKVEEIFIALKLEKIYSKEEILEFYLNNIYFANGYYGIEAASEGYFNRKVEELSLSQAAFLCAIPNNPTLYDPRVKGENTMKRRNRILGEMYEDGKITEEEYNQAAYEEIVLEKPKVIDAGIYVNSYVNHCAVLALMEADGFSMRNAFESAKEQQKYKEEYSKAYEKSKEALNQGGYRIYTTIDLKLQEQLQKVVDEQLEGYIAKSTEGAYTLQAASTCINNDTGCVEAIVGGRSQSKAESALNRAYQSYRQPGSSIKPLIVYAPALEREYTADTKVLDKRVEGGPANAVGVYDGMITLRKAVEKSKNTVAWNVFEEITPEAGLSYLEEMGFAKLDEKDYALPSALGAFTNGTNTVEMASAYAAIANNGRFQTPTCIDKILDMSQNTIYSLESREMKQVYQPQAAAAMTDILEGVLTEGTGKGLALKDMPAAGKTGTTDDNKDGWFVGYTPYYTTSVWVGYDIPQQLIDLSGSSYPGKIWKSFMEPLHEGLERREWIYD